MDLHSEHGRTTAGRICCQPAGPSRASCDSDSVQSRTEDKEDVEVMINEASSSSPPPTHRHVSIKWLHRLQVLVSKSVVSELQVRPPASRTEIIAERSHRKA